MLACAACLSRLVCLACLACFACLACLACLACIACLACLARHACLACLAPLVCSDLLRIEGGWRCLFCSYACYKFPDDTRVWVSCFSFGSSALALHSCGLASLCCRILEFALLFSCALAFFHLAFWHPGVLALLHPCVVELLGSCSLALLYSRILASLRSCTLASWRSFTCILSFLHACVLTLLCSCMLAFLRLPSCILLFLHWVLALLCSCRCRPRISLFLHCYTNLFDRSQPFQNLSKPSNMLNCHSPSARKPQLIDHQATTKPRLSQNSHAFGFRTALGREVAVVARSPSNQTKCFFGIWFQMTF